MIPLSVPFITGNEWIYIKECLDTGWVSSVGSYVSQFEQKMADYIGCRYAVATVNGTAALHLSLLVCCVESGDEVIVPALTFIAPVNVVRYVDADPLFMDCNPDTLCLDVDKLEEFLLNQCELYDDGFTYNIKSKKRIKAIIPVHIFGHPVDMDRLLAVCEKYNISVIEDATESLGSEYNGKKTGFFGKTGCFSFNGNKLITTGGGGMVVTDDENLAQFIKHLSTQAKTDSVEYDHDAIGYNYRLTNLSAAMGVAQMEKLDEFIAIKRKNIQLYKECLSEVKNINLFGEQSWAKSNFWLYTISIPSKDKKPLMEFLISKNIQVRPLWKPIHTLPMYKHFQTYKIESTVSAYNTCLNVPCSVGIKEDEIRYVADCIQNYFA